MKINYKKLKSIITLGLLCTCYAAPGFASDLPDYYITGKHSDTSGFFSNIFYMDVEAGAGLLPGMQAQTLTLNQKDNKTLTQEYKSSGSSIIPYIALGTGWQTNFGHQFGNRLGISTYIPFSSNSKLDLTQGTTTTHPKLSLHSYSFMLDDSIYWDMLHKNLFKMAPYISSGLGMAYNSAKLDTKNTATEDGRYTVDIQPKDTSSIAFAWHIGSGIGFFFQPSPSFRYGQLLSFGYDYGSNGSLNIDYNHGKFHNIDSITGSPLQLKITQQRFTMNYSLTY